MLNIFFFYDINFYFINYTIVISLFNKKIIFRVNLIMDSLASLALATEPPVPELLDRKPHNR